MLAIDFGATRTKVAALTGGMSAPGLISFAGRSWLPSQLYVPRLSGPPLFGDAAAIRSAVDPDGSVDFPMLRRFMSGTLRINKRTVRGSELLRTAIESIRTFSAQNFSAFGGAPARSLVFSVPPECSRETVAAMRSAAVASGCEERELHIVLEPEVAALACSDVLGDASYVVILDCGGSTTRCTAVHADGKRFVLAAAPVSLHDVAANAIDADLFARLVQIADDAGDHESVDLLKEERAIVVAEVARLREVWDGRGSLALDLGDRRFQLEETWIRQSIGARFVQPIVSQLERFLHNHREVIGEGPTVVITGGAASVNGLESGVAALGCEVRRSPNPEATVVLGAIQSQTLGSHSGPVHAISLGVSPPNRSADSRCSRIGQIRVIRRGGAASESEER
jgi:molecular chaperone DnaK (HSP70)